MTTPCRKRGYKVGDLFRVVDRKDMGLTFVPGSIVELLHDDKDDLPQVRLLIGQMYPEYTDDERFYEHIECLEPLT